MWWVLAAFIACPLGIWALVARSGPEDAANAHIGQVVKLEHTGIALSKSALMTIIRASRAKNRNIMSVLASRGQLLTPPPGTEVKITYIELFQETTVFQVAILGGKFQGRSGWVTEEQIHWATPLLPRILPFMDDSPDDIRLAPNGIDSGMDSGLNPTIAPPTETGTAK
jgi:hypothetical protein